MAIFITGIWYKTMMKQKSWPQILFIFSLCIIVGFPCSIYGQSASLTLEDIFLTNDYYAYQGKDMHFMYDRAAYITLDTDSVNVYDMSGKYVETLLTKDKFLSLAGADQNIYDDVEVLPGDLLLLSFSEEDVYRYSTMASYFVFDPSTQKLEELYSSGKIMYPILSPDGKMVAFIYNNNIYIRQLESDSLIQVTVDGKDQEVFNGQSDWVYEEEFDLLSAMVWTADSKHLAFLRFDDSQVSDYTLQKYIGASLPVEVKYKYPKVGMDIPKVSLHIYTVEDSTFKIITLPDSIDYIPRIFSFSDPGKIDLITLNRKQQYLRAFSCDVNDGSVYSWYEERDPRYIEVPVWAHRDVAGNNYISSEKDGNVVLYCQKKNTTVWEPITSSEYAVTTVYGQDIAGNIYFQHSSNEGKERSVSKVIPGGEQEIIFRNGTVEADFSPDFSWSVVKSSGLDEPITVGIARTDNPAEIRYVFRNKEVEERLGKLQVKFEWITVPVNGQNMNAWILKPPHFNKKNKYPVLFTVYGGPGGQNVLNDWDYSTAMWYRYLARQGVMVVAIENRGGDAMGTEMKKCTYSQLGELEVADQFAAAKYIAGLPYIDQKKMAVYGWSYGAYTTLMCMLNDNSPFCAGVAIAPITHWKLYDAIYTERYMGLYTENKSNYEKYSPVNLAGKLKGDLIIAHGTMDDNVHFQHTMEMARTLNAAGKFYTFLPYPNRDHNIYGGNTRFMLFSNITEFLLQRLK